MPCRCRRAGSGAERTGTMAAGVGLASSCARKSSSSAFATSSCSMPASRPPRVQPQTSDIGIQQVHWRCGHSAHSPAGNVQRPSCGTRSWRPRPLTSEHEPRGGRGEGKAAPASMRASTPRATTRCSRSQPCRDPLLRCAAVSPPPLAALSLPRSPRCTVTSTVASTSASAALLSFDCGSKAIGGGASRYWKVHLPGTSSVCTILPSVSRDVLFSKCTGCTEKGSTMRLSFVPEKPHVCTACSSVTAASSAVISAVRAVHAARLSAQESECMRVSVQICSARGGTPLHRLLARVQ